MKCPVCGHSPMDHYGRVERFHPALEIYRCGNCGCLARDMNGIPPDSFYGADYYEGRAEYSYLDERKNISSFEYVWNARLKNIRRFAPSRGRFLDVGCSFGGLVKSAQKWYESYGLDISDYAVQSGNTSWPESSPRLFTGSLVDIPQLGIFEKGTYSVITMIEVAEHLDSPQEHFQAAYELLKPGGLFVIQTANFEGLQASRSGLDYHYFLPGHLVYYRAGALKNLLRETGFSHFRDFFPVDFGVLPKLLKSRGEFTKLGDYLKWLSIIKYHYISKIRWKRKPLTSSYVLYAFKEK